MLLLLKTIALILVLTPVVFCKFQSSNAQWQQSHNQKLTWDHWLGHKFPGGTLPPTTTTTTQEPTDAPLPDDLVRPSSNRDISQARCGVPRAGGADPFNLRDVNMGVWVRLNERKNITVHPTIVGGNNIDVRSACWQAKLQRDGSFICGGSVIGQRTILTASHCVFNPSMQITLSPNRFTVTLGAPRSDTDVTSQDPTGCARTYKVIRIVNNSRYSSARNENDIALLYVDQDIDFSRNCICPICLSSQVPRVGEICSVTGYGLLQEGGNAAIARPLKFVHLDILETSRESNCYINPQTQNLNNILCAGDVPGEDTCQGDSGGPVVCQDPTTQKHYQAGIVSYGIGCARGTGGVYTRVSSFLEWIRINSGGDLLSFPT